MSHETIHLVQAYSEGKRAKLITDTPIRCQSPERAQMTAERLAATKAGVVAYSMSGDPELGEYDDEPVILFRAGRLPVQFEDR